MQAWFYKQALLPFILYLWLVGAQIFPPLQLVSIGGETVPPITTADGPDSHWGDPDDG